MRPGAGTLPDPEFWTVKEASVLMRVSRMTVYRLIHNGTLESVRVGRVFRIPQRAIGSYLRVHGTATPPAAGDTGPAPRPASPLPAVRAGGRA